MKTYILNLTDEENRLLESEIVDVQVWLSNFCQNKIRQVTDRVINDYTDYNPKKLDKVRRLDIVKDIKLDKARIVEVE